MELLRKTAAFRVEAQTKDKSPEEVRTISLSGVPVIHTLIAPFTSMTHLYLVAMKPKLTTLTVLQLSHFPALRLLDVSDNAIKVETAAADSACPSLRRLVMPNNQVSAMDEVHHLARAFPKLEILDLFDNPVMTPDTFKAIFGLFPALAALNTRTADGEEVMVEDSDESDSSDDDDDDAEEEEESDGSTESDVFSDDDDDDEESNIEDASGSDADGNETAVKRSRVE